MDPTGVVVSVLTAVAALGAGVALGRRSHAAERAARRGGAEERAGRARPTGRRGREDRRVQDLILATMQEGVLLLDAGLADRVRERGARAPPREPARGARADLPDRGSGEAVREAAERRAPRSVEVEIGAPDPVAPRRGDPGGRRRLGPGRGHRRHRVAPASTRSGGTSWRTRPTS